MVLTAPGAPLEFQQRDDPVPGPGSVRIRISALRAADEALSRLRAGQITGAAVLQP
jgi:D-arabinose 1-dehydrogenase-like Zn-dependent alcohol dehydrogenase